jgi:hypothetical protein
MLVQAPEKDRLHGVNPRLLFGETYLQFRQPRPCARHKLPQFLQLRIDVNDHRRKSDRNFRPGKRFIFAPSRLRC